MKWWDYSGYFLNFQGRICLEGLIVFGLAGCSCTYFIAPLLDNLYKKIKPKLKKIIAIFLVLLYICDLVISTISPNTGRGITENLKENFYIIEKDSV